MRITDVSPTLAGTEITEGGDYQSVSGRALCVACSPDGHRVYLGGHSGVWRSFDAGLHWDHPEWPSPPSGQGTAPGALGVPNVYDLLVSPADPDLVLAATGRDPQRPDRSGIYLSTDAAATWTLAHRFADGDEVGTVGALAQAPDAPERVFAGGQYAVGVSDDGGRTWRERLPLAGTGDRVHHVVAGPQRGTDRRLYAAGTRVWHSRDGGETWHADPGGRSTASPTDSVGEGSRALAIHPTDPRIVYLRRDETLWRGEFTGAAGDPAVWTPLPAPPTGYAGTTASGAGFVVAHAAPDGQLLLFVSDRRTTHVAVGEPAEQSGWTRVDGGNVHLDPHGLALTPDFRRDPANSPAGRAFLVSDGGAYVSTDGARGWTQGAGIATLGVVNAAVLARPGQPAALCIGTGDNSGFYSRDGGRTWRTQEYVGGDNDCCFADPRQPDRLVVFAPRLGARTGPKRRIQLYTDPDGNRPDASVGTSQRVSVFGPPGVDPTDGAPWNAVSPFYHRGYRPLVLTVPGEAPRPDGDLVTIYLTPDSAKLLRTTALSRLTRPEDWLTSATEEGPGVLVFQVGPDLPDRMVDVVQAAGGHDDPVFYVSDSATRAWLWKWRRGMSGWQQLVPGPDATGPGTARRFFVDPYRPNLLYVLDRDRILRSDDGGLSWRTEPELERALTQEGRFPFDSPYDSVAGQALLRDLAFDPVHPGYRFACGPAGVFHTLDGSTWSPLLLATSLGAHVVNLAYRPADQPCERELYVATSNRGLLRLAPLPPEWDAPVGSVHQTDGRITLLRVQGVGDSYGPPGDRLATEVVVTLDSEPAKAFGLRLRTGADEAVGRGALALLREAFNQDRRIRLDYERTGCRTGTVVRVTQLP